MAVFPVQDRSRCTKLGFLSRFTWRNVNRTPQASGAILPDLPSYVNICSKIMLWSFTFPKLLLGDDGLMMGMDEWELYTYAENVEVLRWH